MKRIIFLLILFYSMTSCTVLYRTIRYGGEDIDDYNVFPTYDFKDNNNKFFFEKSNSNLVDTLNINWKYNNCKFDNLDSLLKTTTTRAFLVIKNDSIIYENYLRGYKKEDFSTVFSVSKSVTSLLIGIAIDEGYVSSVNDPVKKYISELKSADPMFEKLTIKDLLDMRSGIKFKEDYGLNPFSKIARLYYGTNQLSQIRKLHFECEPGTKYNYQSISTAILGVIIEKSTHQSFAEYFEEKVWKPLGMENDGKWSLDDKKNKSAKAFGGLSISAIDLAKIGRLYLNEGKWNGKQIISKGWIHETLTPKLQNDEYQNQWYSFSAAGVDSAGNRYFNDSISAQKQWESKYCKKYPFHEVIKIRKTDYKRKYRKKYWQFDTDYKWILKIYTEQYYALGIMKQILFIDPKKNTIFVRLGDDSDLEDYTSLFYKINSKL